MRDGIGVWAGKVQILVRWVRWTAIAGRPAPQSTVKSVITPGNALNETPIPPDSSTLSSAPPLTHSLTATQPRFAERLQK